MRLKDKVVLFVGAGEHLGRSAPLLFAQEGAKLVIVARRENVLKETAEMIRAKGGTVESVSAAQSTSRCRSDDRDHAGCLWTSGCALQ